MQAVGILILLLLWPTSEAHCSSHLKERLEPLIASQNFAAAHKVIDDERRTSDVAHLRYLKARVLAEEGARDLAHIWARYALRLNPFHFPSLSLLNHLEKKESRLAVFGSGAYPWETLGDTYLIEIICFFLFLSAILLRHRSRRTRVSLVALIVLLGGIRFESRLFRPAWVISQHALFMGPGESYLQRGAVRTGDEVRILDMRDKADKTWVRVRAPNLSEGWVAKGALLD